MTNDECQMTKEIPMTNAETCLPRPFGHLGLGIDSSSVIRYSAVGGMVLEGL